MVTTSPARTPRLLTSEWIRSEGEGPGSLDGWTGIVPDGRNRSRSSWSILLCRHTSSFSVGRGDDEKASAAADRRCRSQAGPEKAAAESGVNVDRTAGLSRKEARSASLDPILLGRGSGPTRRRWICLLYTSPSPRDGLLSRMP